MNTERKGTRKRQRKLRKVSDLPDTILTGSGTLLDISSLKQRDTTTRRKPRRQPILEPEQVTQSPVSMADRLKLTWRLWRPGKGGGTGLIGART